MIPAFLLWQIRIKRTTKIILDVIFLCGLVTAGLSIGRAVTTNIGIWKEDTSWRIQPPNTFSMVEEKAGIVFACCPALRQLVVHVVRTRSIIPRRRQQESEADFIKMRKKVRLRDIFWYRKPHTSQLATFTGAPVYPPEREIDSRTLQHAEETAKKSPLNLWRTSLGAVFGSRKAVHRLQSNGQPALRVEVQQPRRESNRTSARFVHDNGGASWPGSRSELEGRRIEGKYREWHLPPPPSKLRSTMPRPMQSTPSSFFREEDSDENPSPLKGSTLAGSSKYSKSPEVSPEESSISSTKRVSKRKTASEPLIVPRMRSAHVNFSRLRRWSPPSSQISFREALKMERPDDNG